MATGNYQNFPEENFGDGIDQQSPEDKIQPGYVEDLTNVDPTATGTLKKRVGYQGFAGEVPLRVKSYSQSGTNLTLSLDNSISLPISKTPPVIVYGKGSTGTGEFASLSSQYYNTSSLDIRKVFSPGSGSITINASEHGFSTQNLFVETYISDNSDNFNNTRIYVDEIDIDASYNVTIFYTNNSGSDVNVFVGIFSEDGVYSSTGNSIPVGSSTTVINQATHGLTNTTIIAEAYEDVGGVYKKIDYAEFAIDKSTGDVTFSWENNTGSVINSVVLILTDTPLTNIVSGSVGANTTQTINIDTSSTDTSPFLLVRCYLETTLGGDLEEVLPSSVSYSEDTELVTITFENLSNQGLNFEVYYEFIEVTSTSLKLTANTSASVTDSNPELVVYGISHSGLYGSSAGTKAGHINHIDSYRVPSEERMVCGLGGNLFNSVKKTDLTGPTQGSSEINLENRVGSDHVIAPVFHDTGESPGRTRGFITGDTAGSNVVEVSSVQFVSIGIVRYVLNIPNLNINGVLSTVIQVGDVLTVSQCGRAAFNGEFSITSVTNPTTDTLYVEVENSSVISNRFDESDVGGCAGIFSDTLNLNESSLFKVGDKLLSEIFDDTDNFSVLESSGTTIRISGAIETNEIPIGLRLYGRRTSNVIPVKSVDNIVTGDQVSYNEIGRLLTVTAVDTTSVTLTVDESFEFGTAPNTSRLISVENRWVPIEIPTDLYDLTENTRVSHFDVFDYTNQEPIKSTMVQDSLFLTDGNNEVMKYDGVNLYRAGLVRWEPGLFVTTDTTAAAKIIISAAATFKYYFRLDAVDINGNSVASAVTGLDDFTVDLSVSAQVNIKLVGLPAFDAYDYDTINVQVYRTKADSSGPYFLINSTPLRFNKDRPYLIVRDNTSDDELTNNQLDLINSTLLGTEVGTTWDQPPRAKFCTSAGNRLILGNIKGYQKLDLRFFRNGSGSIFSELTAASNKDWIFRRDNTNNSTTPNMADVAHYEFVGTSSASSFSTSDSTSFSTTITGHGKSVGDWVYLFHAAVADADELEFAGWWQVAEVVDVNTLKFNLTDADTLSTAAFPDRAALSTVSGGVPVYLGTDGNYTVNNGSRDSLFVVGRRLSDAINSSMRATTASDFHPWLSASAGNYLNAGQVILEMPRDINTFIEVQAPTLGSSLEVYVNNFLLEGSGQASGEIKVQPSRVVVSYENRPEIFDDVENASDNLSDSAIDVNPADGQEITGIIPFFGDAAFGASQKSSVVVVFKTNSIYLIDLAAKAEGQNPVQKLETEGKGCDAPASITVTRGGIMFANVSGIYRLNRDLSIEYVGQKLERIFQSQVSRSNVSALTGHHDPIDNQYKLSYPVSGGTTNSLVAVYNHTREYTNQSNVGSWTKYDNHPVTGWANGSENRFFASTLGRVFSIRNQNTVDDYRDDSSAIEAIAKLRTLDLGDPGIRKAFRSVTARFKNDSNTSTVEMRTSVNLSTEFTDSGSITMSDESSTEDGISDDGHNRIENITFPVVNNAGAHFQIEVSNKNLDEPMELTGVVVRAKPKTGRKIKQSGSSE